MQNPSSYLDGMTPELHGSDDVTDRKITDMNDGNSIARDGGRTMDPLVVNI